jgi:hypothetical protein
MADSKHAALLLALGAPKGMAKGDDEAPDADSEDDSGAQDILDAIKERDPAALKDALKAFVSSCMSDYDKDDDAPDSEK